ncbi:MAG: hypothetical protein QCI38_01380 [Candidatus Thermoplasmatota archaeon]|nr:hypothetical protein [Candidatus Thermoplasmatota archaeon]
MDPEIVDLDALALEDSPSDMLANILPHVFSDLPFPPGFLITDHIRQGFMKDAWPAIKEVLDSSLPPGDASIKVGEILSDSLIPPETEMLLARCFKSLAGKEMQGGILLVDLSEHDSISSSVLCESFFTAETVADKMGLLRRIWECLADFFTPAMVEQWRKNHGAEFLMLLLAIPTPRASGTATAKLESGSLEIKASRGWSTGGARDLYVISLEDGKLLNMDVSPQERLLAMRQGALLEEELPAAERANRKLGDPAILDLYSYARAVVERRLCKDGFSFAWIQPDKVDASPLILHMACEKKKRHVSAVSAGEKSDAFVEAEPEGGTAGVKSHQHGRKTSGTVVESGGAGVSTPEPHAMAGSGVLDIPVQPTATAIISMGGKEPWFPPTVAPWLSDAQGIASAGDVVDLFITFEEPNAEEFAESLRNVRAGRLFIVASPDNLEEAGRLVSLLPRGRALLMARITEASHAFLTEDMGDMVDGIFVDIRSDGERGDRVLARTVDAVKRSMGKKKVVVNAADHFWSEEFLSAIIIAGTYGIAVPMSDVAVASAMVAGTERRLILQRSLEG